MRRGSCCSQRDDKAPARGTDGLASLDTISDYGADGLGRALVVEQKTDGTEGCPGTEVPFYCPLHDALRTRTGRC
jgi:hypothetical protein